MAELPGPPTYVPLATQYWTWEQRTVDPPSIAMTPRPERETMYELVMTAEGVQLGTGRVAGARCGWEVGSGRRRCHTRC